MDGMPRRTVGWSALGLTITCAALLIATGGCDDDDDAGYGPPTELEGTWVGNEVGDPSTVWTFTMTGSHAYVSATTGEWYGGVFSLNTAVTPKQLTMTITSCVAPVYVGSTSLGIYDLVGTDLTFAASAPGDPVRPTDYSGSGSSRVWNLTKQ